MSDDTIIQLYSLDTPKYVPKSEYIFDGFVYTTPPHFRAVTLFGLWNCYLFSLIERFMVTNRLFEFVQWTKDWCLP